MIDSTSRYRDVPLLSYKCEDGREVRYLERRFPSTTLSAGTSHVRVNAGDRPDLIAARALGDPLAFWRIAELNGALDPWELTAIPGRRIALPSSGTTF